ncbi:hypothetical protein BJ508DRAFT_321558 [Ascobolus immersus RN42]|uniref:Uncharacterized protein n=1 Tax=Ascobolus immersus RN42 TaxID=1160509 RepID=A0A3N4IKM1_ASCIM|nr:hypothetical protein BJ508DRAFT_321558 [Ascobolus immersus RN42]
MPSEATTQYYKGGPGMRGKVSFRVHTCSSTNLLHVQVEEKENRSSVISEQDRKAMIRELKDPLLEHILDKDKTGLLSPAWTYCAKKPLTAESWRALCPDAPIEQGSSTRVHIRTVMRMDGRDFSDYENEEFARDHTRLIEINLDPRGKEGFLGWDVEDPKSIISSRMMRQLQTSHPKHPSLISLYAAYTAKDGKSKFPSPLEVLETIPNDPSTDPTPFTGNVYMVINGLEWLVMYRGKEKHLRSLLSEFYRLATTDRVIICWTTEDEDLFQNASEGQWYSATKRLNSVGNWSPGHKWPEDEDRERSEPGGEERFFESRTFDTWYIRNGYEFEPIQFYDLDETVLWESFVAPGSNDNVEDEGAEEWYEEGKSLLRGSRRSLVIEQVGKLPQSELPVRMMRI